VRGPAELAIADMLLRLRLLNRALREAVKERRGRSGRVHGMAAGQLYVSDDHARALIDELDRAAGKDSGRVALEPEAGERAATAALRARAEASGETLPLDRLAGQAGLGAFEVGCVVACAAPDLEPGYERVYGYIVDDLSRGRPSVELLLALTGAGVAGRLRLRSALAPFGALRRHRILVACGEASGELRQELALAPGLLDLLLGEAVDDGWLVADPYDVPMPASGSFPPGTDTARVRRLGDALREKRLSVLGIWGGDELARERLAAETARAAGLSLRRFDPGRDATAEALHAAAALRSLVWIDCDSLTEADQRASFVDEDVLRRSRVPLCLTGAEAWRPARLVASRSFAEIQLDGLSFMARRRLWAEALPEVGDAVAADLAARFPIDGAQVDAAAALARVEAAVSPNGRDLGRLAGAASAKVARPRSYRFATVVRPSRSIGDLVLPPELHRQVGEIASFYRSWPWILEDWSLRLRAPSGLRVLFTGEPGTGKTLAAEVIAGELGLELLKINLARVVSRWLGETERNLEAGFEEAERSASVLFFDEADALFAKRGEVRHGTDRYSNLEVGYLLQRMESYSGLVVLATNLRDNLDEAFTRRFNVILHFPRPTAEERRRIWELALPPASTENSLDLDVLAGVDMTGAGIVAVAQTAALLAASEGGTEIEMRHVVQATARQFRREGRILSPAELRQHAALL
jgi:ATPase family associated with various cellular activities (AAA)